MLCVKGRGGRGGYGSERIGGERKLSLPILVDRKEGKPFVLRFLRAEEFDLLLLECRVESLIANITKSVESQSSDPFTKI